MSAAQSLEATEPLLGDPQREAADLQRGIVFQIWSGLRAWMDLTDQQQLWLEGAEDYDVVDVEDATAVQLKATAANITLRSDSVIDALNSYWLIRSQNNKNITFRFITTSAVGTERSDPLGAGNPGARSGKSVLMVEILK